MWVIFHQTKEQYFVLIVSQNRRKTEKWLIFAISVLPVCDLVICSSHLNVSIFASVDHD